MKWNERYVTPPKDRPILIYCPDFNTLGYAVATWNGYKFCFDDYPDFDKFVELWSLFLEAD